MIIQAGHRCVGCQPDSSLALAFSLKKRHASTRLSGMPFERKSCRGLRTAGELVAEKRWNALIRQCAMVQRILMTRAELFLDASVLVPDRGRGGCRAPITHL